MPALEQSKFASVTRSLMLSSSFFRMEPERNTQMQRDTQHTDMTSRTTHTQCTQRDGSSLIAAVPVAVCALTLFESCLEHVCCVCGV